MDVFELRNIATEEAASLLIKAFDFMDSSELLMHEICYTLGQMPIYDISVKFLKKVVADEKEFPVVRHEAGEALGNFGLPELADFLEKYTKSEIEVLRDTCILSFAKTKSFPELKSRYGLRFGGAREPAAPFIESELEAVLKGRTILEFMISDEHLF